MPALRGGAALTAARREQVRDHLGRVVHTRGLGEHGRVPLHHPDLPFILLTSQKAGSTAVTKWFLHHAGLLDDARDHGRWIHDYELNVFKARPGYRRELRRALAAGADVVKVVRDPAARTFSGYLELNEHWAVLQRLDHWTVYWRCRVIRDLFGPSGDYIQPFSFLQYLGWLVDQDEHRLNPHLAPQRTRFDQSLGRRLRVHRLEDGPALLRELEVRYGLRATGPEELGGLLQSGHHNAKAPLDGRDLRAALREGYRAHRPPGSTFPELSTALLDHDQEVGDLLRRACVADYAAYGHLYR